MRTPRGGPHARCLGHTHGPDLGSRLFVARSRHNRNRAAGRDRRIAQPFLSATPATDGRDIPETPRAGVRPEYQSLLAITDRESYHARLAYQVGRGAQYCGWPFNAACTQSPTAGFRFRGAGGGC